LGGGEGGVTLRDDCLPRSHRLVLQQRELRQRNQIATFKAVEIVH
jgi:hypothetical protein